MMLRAIMEYGIQWNLSNLDTNGAGESVIVSEVRGVLISEVARVVLGVGIFEPTSLAISSWGLAPVMFQCSFKTWAELSKK